VLHVHDLVDFVSEESAKAGANAYKYVQGQLAKEEETLEVVNGFGVSGAVPQHISKKLDEPITIMFRPRGVYKDAKVCIDVGDVQATEKKSRILTPGEMVTLKFTPEYLQKNANADKITVRVEAQQS
jgi:sarcosine oxidase subunit alpha